MVSSGNSRHAAFLSALRSVAVNSLAPDAALSPAVIARPPSLSLVHGTPDQRGAGKATMGHILVAQRTIRKRDGISDVASALFRRNKQNGKNRISVGQTAHVRNATTVHGSSVSSPQCIKSIAIGTLLPSIQSASSERSRSTPSRA